MKVSRNYLNKVAKVTWKDPTSDNERQLIDKAKKGQGALAKWDEYGYIDDISDGVVRMRHSVAYSAGETEPDEAIFGYIVEDLITGIEILVPEKEEN
jgi:hypothetical protein